MSETYIHQYIDTTVGNRRGFLRVVASILGNQRQLLLTAADFSEKGFVFSHDSQVNSLKVDFLSNLYILDQIKSHAKSQLRSPQPKNIFFLYFSLQSRFDETFLRTLNLVKMNWKVISLLVVVRVASVFIVKTFFSPDEYWQATEVAHKLTFG